MGWSDQYMGFRPKASAVILSTVGIVFLANPLYILPAAANNAGFDLTEQYVGAAAVLGFLSIIAAIAIERDVNDRLGVCRSIGVVAIAALLAFLPYAWVLEGLAGLDLAGLFISDLVEAVGATVAGFFVIGAAITTRRPRALLNLVPIIVLGAIAGIVSQGEVEAVLKTLLGFIVFSGLVVLGDGLLFYVAGLVLGMVYGRAV